MKSTDETGRVRIGHGPIPEVPSEATGSSLSPVSGELIVSDYDPDLEGWEIAWETDWVPPSGNRKNAYRDGRDLLNDRPVRVYENGAIKERGTGLWLRSAPSIRITSENHAEMTALKRARAVEAATKGLVDAYLESGGKITPRMGMSEIEMLAWAEVIKSRALIAMDPSRGRDGTDAARFVGRTASLIGDEKGNVTDGSKDAIRFEVTGRAALEALRMLNERNKGE